MSTLPSIPLKWDVDAVREFYAERGLDYDRLSPRHFGRFMTFEQEAAEKEQFDFDKEYAEFLLRRSRRREVTST